MTLATFVGVQGQRTVLDIAFGIELDIAGHAFVLDLGQEWQVLRAKASTPKFHGIAKLR